MRGICRSGHIVTFKIECGVLKMPKMKTKSGAAKRFKKTANGFKHKQSFTSHILTKKSPKRKRQLRGTKLIAKSDVASIKRMLAQ